MIRLSINKNLKLEKGKGEEKQRRSKQGSFMWSSSHITAKFCQVLPPSSAKFCHQVLPSSASAVTLPPPPQKPALRLYISVLYLQGVFIFVFFQQLIIFAILALYLLIQVFQGPQFTRVTVIEFLKLIGTTNKVLYGVLGRIQVISFPTYIVLQRSPYKSIGQYLFNFPLIFAINLNQQQGQVYLF